MTKWVRWGGLIAFLIIIGVVSGLWLLLIDGLVERTIETEGTKMVGAKVELDGADLSLLPAGLVLKGLHVTDPANPMTNAVEVARLALTLDGLHLLRRKVIVEEMTVDGVRIGTPRETSGAVRDVSENTHPDQQPSNGERSFSMPTFDVPDVKQILNDEDFETLKLVESLKADIQQERQQWEQRLKDLPGKETFAKYQARVEKLKGASKGGLGGVLGGVGEIQSIKKEIESDIESLKTAQKDFTAKAASLKGRLEQIKKAPLSDIKRLQDKYSLSPQGLANISGPLLGRHIGGWAHQAVAWFERIRPLLESGGQGSGNKEEPQVVEPIRAEGVDVRFQETNPLPEFLIRRADVSLQLEIGDLSGKVENITPDQGILGKPLTLDFSGEKLKGLRSITMKGVLNHIDPDNSIDDVDLRIAGYRFQNVSLSDQAEWPVGLEKGQADVTVQAGLRGKALKAKVKGNLKELQITAGKPDDANPLTRSLSSALSGVSTLAVQADITGTLEKYDVALSSDLDRIMKKAAGKMVQDLSARFQKELTAGISEKVHGPLKDLKGSFDGFNGIGGDLVGRLTQSNDLLGNLLKKPLGQKGLPGGLTLPF